MSTVTQFTPIPERSDATPGLFNSRFQTVHDNIVALNASAATLAYYPALSVESGIAAVSRFTVPWFNPYRYGAVGNKIADDGPPVQGAIDAASPYFATVDLDRGSFKHTSTFTTRAGVNIIGRGGLATVLYPTNCDALKVEWYGLGYGHTIFSDFGIDGQASCSTRTAIANTGTGNASTDELDGLLIKQLLIQNFGTGMKFRTVRNAAVQDVWLNKVTNGITIEGQTIGFRIEDVYLIGNGGPTGGGGVNTGIMVRAFTYSVGGTLQPESVHLLHATVFGFSTAVQIDACTYTNMLGCDLESAVTGISFTGAADGLTIRDCFVEVDGVTGLAGIVGHSLAASQLGTVTIASNTVIGTGHVAATSNGIQLNDGANQWQDSVSIRDNYLTGWTAWDIIVSQGNGVAVENNRCDSTGVTGSIDINAPVGPNPVRVDGNRCAKGIAFNNDLMLSGLIEFGTNVVSGSTRSYGPRTIPSGTAGGPSLRFDSELSLGLYRSGASTLAPSYGTFNLATNAVRFSMRTLAASSITASAAQANVAVNEVVFTIGGASGASLCIMSGGTLHYFNSAGSAKQT